MTYSKRFARLFKRSFGTAEIETALQMIAALKTGTAVDAEVADFLSHFPSFLNNFDEVHEQYEDRMKVALRNIEISSNELNDANLELERLNLTINAMLESLGQGLFFFDASGMCGSVHSRACLTLLEGSPVGRPISDVLKLDKQAETRLQALMEIVFDPARTAMSFEDLIALAPPWYPHSQGRKIALSYKPMYKNADNIRAILVIASDVTREIAVQEAIHAQEMRARRILRLVRERQGFRRFIDSLRGLSALLPESTPATLRHDLHTLKGNARFFYLDSTATTLHELESRLASLPADAKFPPHERAAAAEVLALAMDNSLSSAHEIWGQEFDTAEMTTPVALDTLYHIGRQIENGVSAADLAHDFWHHLAAVSARYLVSSLESQITYFAERENREVDVHVDVDKNLRILPARYQTLVDTLVHIAKNIAVHAADPPEMRMAAGKPAALQVSLVIAPAQDDVARMILTIRDDGCGVDTERLRARLLQKDGADKQALAAMGADEILQTIFDDDMTISDRITEQSGRGVGLGALRRAVENLGGRISAESSAGAGLCLRLDLPVLARPAPN
ncbi:MAG: ATP-binding protein [Alphaproteobacteria bacterium]|nr:ATP-binding protein [Alphaproteobacteria bacterium]